MSLHVLLLLAAIVCAAMAVRARPLHAALWLAALSALIAIVLYRLGAPEVAVIELSVGAGLITVLFAFAISMAEDEAMPAPLVPRPFAWLLVDVAGGVLLWLLLPALPAARQIASDAPFIVQIWDNRALDLALQIVIVLTGVMGVLSLLGETRAPESPAVEARQ
jgi:uncharacterized MnhB-related membrane protein